MVDNDDRSYKRRYYVARLFTVEVRRGRTLRRSVGVLAGAGGMPRAAGRVGHLASFRRPELREFVATPAGLTMRLRLS